mmetsp:Transcript_57974/g.141649  ORF Transcript_57974/g.141649 Transcript_57974/m.141649 type:complete len:110 (-) Transcript_57974:1417-1746(-)
MLRWQALHQRHFRYVPTYDYVVFLFRLMLFCLCRFSFPPLSLSFLTVNQSTPLPSTTTYQRNNIPSVKATTAVSSYQFQKHHDSSNEPLPAYVTWREFTNQRWKLSPRS